MRVNNSHSGVSMRLLLLNNNPAVSRLIKLSAEKAGYELDEFEDYGLVPLTTYDVILVDNELYEESAVTALREHTGCDYVVYICQRGAKKPEAMNVSLEKPFLPTDFLVLMDKIKNVIASHKMEESDEEEPLSQMPKEEADAFDIDKIDAEDDDMLPINLLEEYDDDFKEESANEKITFDDLALDDINLEDELLEGKASEEKELMSHDDAFSFDDVKSIEEESADSLEDFDFEENEHNNVVNTLEADDLDLEEDHNPSILDKDDINEVKQLLDESEDNEDEKEIDELSLDALNQEEDDKAGTFFFDEKEAELDPLVEDELLGIEDNDIASLSLDELTFDTKEDAIEETLEEEHSAVVDDDQEEIIDDFAEAVDEKIEEEKEQALEEEALLPKVDLTVSNFDQIEDIDSLDDLSENMLKQAFGEEVEHEELISPVASAVPTAKNQEIEVIRDEIESSIAKSISSLAQSDILREALKGMRLNISITFDEKE